jgi:hypothetical protein
MSVYGLRHVLDYIILGNFWVLLLSKLVDPFVSGDGKDPGGHSGTIWIELLGPPPDLNHGLLDRFLCFRSRSPAFHAIPLYLWGQETEQLCKGFSVLGLGDRQHTSRKGFGFI